MFLQLHGKQLISCGIPEHFWEKLHEKLQNEVSHFQYVTSAAFSTKSYDAHRYVMFNCIEYLNEDGDDSNNFNITDTENVNTNLDLDWEVTVCGEELSYSAADRFVAIHLLHSNS